MTYEDFIKQCKEKGASKPYMKEKEFNEAFGIETDQVIPPLHIRPKNQCAVKPTIENHIKMEKQNV